MARGYEVKDDSVTVSNSGGAQYAGKSMTQRGEDVVKKKLEAGRYEYQPEETNRPVGKSTARDSTGVKPDDPIDERMPNIRTP